jgi:hypothetical protein
MAELVMPRGRTRWRRFFLVFGPVMGMVLVALVLMARGVLALPIVISGTQFTVQASNLSVPAADRGCSTSSPNSCAFVQYGDVDLTQSNGAVHAVTVTALKGAVLSNLTQTICAPTGLGGPVSNLKVVITANPATASNLMVDATKLSGDATFTGMKIGVPVTSREGTVTFGQTAENVSINGLSQTALYTSAGTFKLTGLGLNASFASSC